MNRIDLVKKLELLSPALAKENLVPLFQCFAFDSKQVSAYNDALAIVATCQTKEAFAVNGITLLGLLKASHSEEVEFAIDDEESLTVKAGKSRFKLPYFRKDEFLFKAPNDGDGIIKMEDNFLKGLQACLLTTSTDLAQRALMGIALRKLSKNAALYSSDGDAITRYKLPSLKNINQRLLPNSFCEAVVRTAKEVVTEESYFGLTEDWAISQVGAYTIYGRLIEVEPIDYEQEMSNTLDDHPQWVTVPRGLDNALSRARVIADPESLPTTIEVADGKMRLHTESTASGQVRDVLPYPGKDVTVSLSSAMMQRAIGLCNQMCLTERCAVYKSGDELFMIVGNMD